MAARPIEESKTVGQPAGLLDRVCRWFAILGGLVLGAVALITVVSVTGRYLFSRPISGDFELVGMLTAVAVSLFLPHCQLRRGNVIVDVFTERASPRTRALLDAFGSLALAVVVGIIAWRMAVGGLELRAARDETMLLRLPTWWGFLVVVPAFALLTICSLVTLRRDLAQLRRQRETGAR